METKFEISYNNFKWITDEKEVPVPKLAKVQYDVPAGLDRNAKFEFMRDSFIAAEKLESTRALEVTEIREGWD